MNLNEIKVGTRLSMGFAVVLLLFLGTTLLGLSRLSLVQASIDEITVVGNEKTRLATAMRETVFERLIALRTAALVGSTAEMQLEVDRIAAEKSKYQALERRLNSMLSDSDHATPEEKKLLLAIRSQEMVAVPLIDKAMQLALAAQSDLLYKVLVEELMPAQKNWMDALGKLVVLESTQSLAAGESARRSYVITRAWMFGIGVCALVSCVLAAYLLNRKLMHQLGGEPFYAVDMVERIAAGDLSVDIKIRPNDTSSLLFAMKTMRDKLAAIVGTVRAESDSIAVMSREIADGNADFSVRTERQAISIEATAVGINQLMHVMQRNVENAQQANGFAVSASEVARKGNLVMSEVSRTMALIKASAKKIAEIIGVIDGIAFQTNILALNAAVEAARAQEHGRGFAVVASEVRGLAQRAAAAALEIKSLIHESVGNVESGGRLVGDAGQTMNEIVDGVGKVMSIMNDIFMASNAQSDGISKSNRSIAEIDEATRQNVALVEQATVATDNLQQYASRVSETLSVFKISGGTSERLEVDRARAHAPKLLV